jgi:hypothetical protein
VRRPTSAFWLNPVERGFAKLTKRKLRRSAHRSVVELEREVWIKTANEILAPSPPTAQQSTAQDPSR